MRYKDMFFILGGVWLLACFAPILFSYTCTPNHDQYAVEPSETVIQLRHEDPCGPEHSFDAVLCIDDNEELSWHTPWSECFEQFVETSWEPALGIMQLNSQIPICENYFEFHRVKRICNVPTPYSWEVEPTHNFYTCTLTFEPDECLAETIPNCYIFKFRLICPL